MMSAVTLAVSAYKKYEASYMMHVLEQKMRGWNEEKKC
jgi:hypothetical protein